MKDDQSPVDDAFTAWLDSVTAEESATNEAWHRSRYEILKRIVSGGQTGVDRAGLDAALQMDFPCGGWCPQGRVDEDGIIPDHYPLKELKKGGYHQRTLQNIIDSDGTLIIYDGALEGGTAQTLFRCIKQRKPYRLIDARETAPARAAQLAHRFVVECEVETLNIAGPRASKWNFGYDYTLRITQDLIEQAKLDKSQ